MRFWFENEILCPTGGELRMTTVRCYFDPITVGEESHFNKNCIKK
ncbi:hypothetical protein [Deferribacter autotrophicus]|nr:hypothetical protein [Deferribacter autotrophicus]